MKQNKMSKYFKYAIGEIILVVIGILIALQINNWNQTIKEQERETTYLKNIQRDLKNQTISIDTQISNETMFMESADYIIRHYMDNDFKKSDSIFFTKLTDLHSRKTFLITDPTFTDLLSSGNIDLIKNTHFKDQLIQYYQELERIEKIIQNNNSLLVDQQYGNVFMKSGYYYDYSNLELSHVKNQKSKALRVIYHKELAKTSSELLQNPERKLQLMNVVNLRHAISLGSLGLMEKSKEDTKLLLGELNKILND